MKLGVLLLVLVGGCAPVGWKQKLANELPAFGHRNWIVVADAAYPKQSADGIETVYAGGDQLEVLKAVLGEVDAAKHVQPIVWVDAELKHVAEADAPGVGAYRNALDGMLAGRQVKRVPHEQIIRKLDEDAATFNVLLIKTDMVLPYTSVFLQLDCGYWDGAREKRLRQALER